MIIFRFSQDYLEKVSEFKGNHGSTGKDVTGSVLTVQDAASVVIAVSRKKPELVWKWFQSEFENNNRVLRLQLHRLIPIVVSSFSDETRLEELKQFYYKNRHRLGRGKDATEMAIEIVKNNIALKDHKEKVLNWFKTKYPALSSSKIGQQVISFDLEPEIADYEDDFFHLKDSF